MSRWSDEDAGSAAAWSMERDARRSLVASSALLQVEARAPSNPVRGARASDGKPRSPRLGPGMTPNSRSVAAPAEQPLPSWAWPSTPMSS
jgi:anti-sigma factor RsiW